MDEQEKLLYEAAGIISSALTLMKELSCKEVNCKHCGNDTCKNCKSKDFIWYNKERAEDFLRKVGKKVC